MFKIGKAQLPSVILTVGMLGYACGPTDAAVRIEGQVQAGGGPIANSTVTLWGASAVEPRQLAQTTMVALSSAVRKRLARMSSSTSSQKAAKRQSTRVLATTRRLHCSRWLAICRRPGLSSTR